MATSMPLSSTMRRSGASSRRTRVVLFMYTKIVRSTPSDGICARLGP